MEGIDPGRGRNGPGAGVPEESEADVRRYLNAVSRSRWLIAVTVILITGIVVALSLSLPKRYEATARILVDDETSLISPSDAESQQRRLATLETVTTSPAVLDEAAGDVAGETQESLEDKVESRVDEQANVIDIAATDRSPQVAADVANAVAEGFLEVNESTEQERLTRARSALQEDLQRLSASGDSAEVGAIRERLSELNVQISTAGSELQLSQRAEVPTDPSSPQPVRNGIIAIFGSLFLGILLALGRDQLRPGVRGPRELGRLMGGVPVLATVPYVRRRLLRRRRASTTTAAEHEAYQTLRASVKLALGRGSNKIVLVSSAVHGEGKTTVTARLGRALAQAGQDTLLISADLRVPTLHSLFGMPDRPGLADAIGLAERAGVSDYILPATVREVGVPGFDGAAAQEGKLHLLTSGTTVDDPARLLSSEAAGEFFEHIRGFDYDYVLIDTPPMLGIADIQALGQHADELLLVSRLDRLTTEAVIDTRELLDRLRIRPIGLVVIGGSPEPSHYYFMSPGRAEEAATRPV